MKRQEERENAAKMKYPYKGGVKGDICQACIPIFIEGAKWADDTMIEKAISKCAVMLLNIDELLRKKGLKGQFEEEFDNEFKRFKKSLKE